MTSAPPRTCTPRPPDHRAGRLRRGRLPRRPGRAAGVLRPGRGPDPAGPEGDPVLPARRPGGPAAQRGGVAVVARPTRRSRIDRPIFVTGLPRTGTTALHRLLTADPAHQGLEMWLTQAPGPRPPRDTWAANPVFRQIQAGYERHHAEHPEFMGVHYMAADQVEECWQLLRQSMRSVSYECLAHLPGYSRWLRRPGLDRRLPQAPAQPAAHRPARPRPPLGAEEPQPPVRARRAARRVPGRAGDPDAPRPPDRDRLGVQPGRAGVRRAGRPRSPGR